MSPPRSGAALLKRHNSEFQTKVMPYSPDLCFQVNATSCRNASRSRNALLSQKPIKHLAGSKPARNYPEETLGFRQNCSFKSEDAAGDLGGVFQRVVPHMLYSCETLFCLTCSMSALSEVSSSMLYLARIFRMGRSFSHHCSLGMRCLGGWREDGVSPARRSCGGAGGGRRAPTRSLSAP